MKDERIVELDNIVTEVKSSEEWENVSMNIYERGIEQGIEQGQLLMLYKLVDSGKFSLEEAAETIGKNAEELRNMFAELNVNIQKE